MSYEYEEFLEEFAAFKSLFKNMRLKRDNTKQYTNNSGSVRIVVLQRGWVSIGRFFQKGNRCWLENAATIRVWGTTGKAGLSYLAINGPTDETILDKTPLPIRFHELTIVHMYDCADSVWKEHLK